jgi:hypothetical protein
MKNGLIKISFIIFAFVVVGGALNSMSASFMTQCRSGKLDTSSVVAAGVDSVKSDLYTGKDVTIDIDETQNIVAKAIESAKGYFSDCSDRASNLIDVDAILMVEE